MVIVKIRDGVTRLSGRNKGEWMLVPYWPLGARTIRNLARPGLSKEWLEEVIAFAESEVLERS